VAAHAARDEAEQAALCAEPAEGERGEGREEAVAGELEVPEVAERPQWDGGGQHRPGEVVPLARARREAVGAVEPEALEDEVAEGEVARHDEHVAYLDPHLEDREPVVVARRGEGDGGQEGGRDDGQVREVEQGQERAAMPVGHVSRAGPRSPASPPASGAARY